MRKFLGMLVILVAPFMLLTGCTVMQMQNFNQGLGGECLEIECEFGYWDSDKGEYLMGYYITKHGNEDISTNESRWLQRMTNQFLDRESITTYTETSPYSNTEYKFDVLCVEWR